MPGTLSQAESGTHTCDSSYSFLSYDDRALRILCRPRHTGSCGFSYARPNYATYRDCPRHFVILEN